MLKRLIVGLITGFIMGAIVAAVLVKGLGLLVFPGILAYVFAAVTGVFVGLIAGKPIWAKGGQIEAGLKAIVGAVVGAVAMFALRRWVEFPVDLSAIGAGYGVLGSLPAASLPIIAALLGGFYELDNTDEPEDAKKTEKTGKPGAVAKKNVRVAPQEEAEEEADAEPPKRAKRS
ncbi:MAG: hypothetical protein ABIP39_13970 [Polyangiaceae bacterium]